MSNYPLFPGRLKWFAHSMVTDSWLSVGGVETLSLYKFRFLFGAGANKHYCH